MSVWVTWSIGLGVAALAAAAALWALFWDRPRGLQRCPRCFYDMAGASEAQTPTCPECGHAAASARALCATRRRWRIAIAAGLIAGVCGWIAPVWATRGWVALVPAPVLDLVIGAFFREDAASAFSAPRSPNALNSAWELSLISFHTRAAIADLDPDSSWRDPVVSKVWGVLRYCNARQRRLLTRSVAQAAARAPDGSELRSVMLGMLQNDGGANARLALPILWRMCAEGGAEYGQNPLRTIMEIDPALRRAERNDEKMLRWYRRAFRRTLSDDLRLWLVRNMSGRGGRFAREAEVERQRLLDKWAREGGLVTPGAP